MAINQMSPAEFRQLVSFYEQLLLGSSDVCADIQKADDSLLRTEINFQFYNCDCARDLECMEWLSKDGETERLKYVAGLLTSIEDGLCSHAESMPYRYKGPTFASVTLLHVAVATGRMDALKCLLAVDKLSLKPSRNFQLLPIHVAILQGNRTAFDFLSDRVGVQNGINVRVKFSKREGGKHIEAYHALEIACLTKQVHFARHILKTTTGLNKKVLTRSLNWCVRDEQFGLMEELLDIGATPNFETILLAIEKNVLEVIEPSADHLLNARACQTFKHVPDPVRLAIEMDKEKYVKLLLRRGMHRYVEQRNNVNTSRGRRCIIKPSQRDQEEVQTVTNVMLAVFKGSFGILEEFVARYIIPREEIFQYTAVDVCNCFGYNDCAELIKRVGVQPNPSATTLISPYFVVMSLALDSTLVCRLLSRLQRNGFDINQSSAERDSVLFACLRSNRCNNYIRHLLRLGADPNCKTPSGVTPLFESMSKCKLTAIKELIYFNANLETACVLNTESEEKFEEKSIFCLAVEKEVSLKFSTCRVSKVGLRKWSDPRDDADSLTYVVDPVAIHKLLSPVSILLYCGYKVCSEELEKCTQVKTLHKYTQNLIEDMITQPRSLKVICRNVLRRAIPGSAFVPFVQTQDIPSIIKNFLLLKPVLVNDFRIACMEIDGVTNNSDVFQVK